MPLASALRVALLVALLAAECVAVMLLRRLGWLRTGSLMLWCASLALATTPLLLAAALLVGRRLRFSLRALIAVMTLVAIFLVIVGIPLRNAIDARQLSGRLIKAKASVRAGDPSPYNWRIGSISQAAVRRDPRADLPSWLEPLAGDTLKVPAHASVTSIGFTADEQIAIFASAPDQFINLHEAGVESTVTPQGLKQLVAALERVPSLRQFSVMGPVTQDILIRLSTIEFVMLQETAYSTDSPPAAPTLNAKHFAAIAALPNLKALIIIGHDVRSRDATPLANSRTLQLIRFRRLVTPLFSIGGLREQLPNCDITLE